MLQEDFGTEFCPLSMLLVPRDIVKGSSALGAGVTDARAQADIRHLYLQRRRIAPLKAGIEVQMCLAIYRSGVLAIYTLLGL